MPSRLSWYIAVTIVPLIAVGCRQDAIAPTPRRLIPTYSLSNGVVVNLDDVRELEVDSPPGPRPWDQSDSALVQALEQSGHKAYVAFKKPGSLRFVETKHLAVQEPWNPKRMVNKGVRASIDGGTIRAGLAFVEARGGKITSYLNYTGMAIVSIDPRLGPELRANPLIDYVEPVLAKYELASSSSQSAAAQRAFFTQTTGWGITAVHASTAWSMSTGTGARLLIMDTGHEQSHGDLLHVPSNNCFSNGCNDISGYPHGTWVSGVVIARNNSIGTIGVAPGLDSTDVFYSGACHTASHVCDADSVVVALNWAANNLGSKGVINLSMVSPTYDAAAATAIAGAWAAGHILVAPVGNAVNNVTEYPAAYSNVVGVSGLNSDLSFAAQGTVTACSGTWSNYGSFVDISGPFDVYTTDEGNSYSTRCGTSFATPHVVGAALIARAVHPTWSNSDGQPH